MKIFSNVLLLAAMLSVSSETVRADDRVCQDISLRVNQADAFILAPLNRAIGSFAAAGLTPYNIQNFLAVIGQYSQAYMTVRNLQHEYSNRQCSDLPLIRTPACLGALSMATVANTQYLLIHDNFSRAVLTGNVPQALPVIGEVIRTRRTLEQVNAAVRSQCISR